MNISSKIDHTLLKPDCNHADIRKWVEEAIQHQFANVCIPPYMVKEASRLLENHKTGVCTVIGFPFGYNTTPIKVEEIKRAIDEGADELDAVINISAVKCADWSFVSNDIESMVRSTQMKDKKIKIILETGLMTAEEITKLCEIIQVSKPNFVKTSTGFNGPGANVEIIQLLRATLSTDIKIKASGGIKTKSAAEKLILAGADRIGSSNSVLLVS
ncbi:MAG: deoxyribose-phosphate aldolase [Saprospiraceae bacterium]|nr:deoxyribose-phosphate aldolase [Saprospiraceae bacterium]